MPCSKAGKSYVTHSLITWRLSSRADYSFSISSFNSCSFSQMVSEVRLTTSSLVLSMLENLSASICCLCAISAFLKPSYWALLRRSASKKSTMLPSWPSIWSNLRFDWSTTSSKMFSSCEICLWYSTDRPDFDICKVSLTSFAGYKSDLPIQKSKETQKFSFLKWNLLNF